MGVLARTTVGLGALGLAGVSYAAGFEVRAFRVRAARIACLPAGHSELRVLHLSDIHITPTQRAKKRWLRGLADLAPDLVVNTGDNLSHRDAVPVVMEALGDLRDVPGVYVFGSNDYWGPIAKNPLRYFLPNGGQKKMHGPALPWRELRTAFDDVGWLDLSNRKGELRVRDSRIAFAGVDDPHLHYDKLDEVAGPADPSADLRLAIAHAPYLRVLDAFTRDGYDAILAGHTHGGQLRLPGYGALVTNCDLDRARSRGLSAHVAGGRQSALHVSAGIGTSPYAPYRFCCYPEATLITLTAGEPQGSDQPVLDTARPDSLLATAGR